MAYTVKLPPVQGERDKNVSFPGDEKSIVGSPYPPAPVKPVTTGDDGPPDFPFSLVEPDPAPSSGAPTRSQPEAPKRLGRFTSCLWCGSGTWTRYAGLPTCSPCARSWSCERTPDQAKAYLWRLLDLWTTMDESEMSTSVLSGQAVAVWSEPNVKALHEDIMDVFAANREANTWFAEWRALHPEAKLA